MSDPTMVSSSVHYFEEAKIMLEKKDLLGFVSKISKAEILAQSENSKEMLSEISYLQVEGLYTLKQYKKAVEFVPETLLHYADQPANKKLLKIKNYQGVMVGYLGELQQAKAIFSELLEADSVSDKEFYAEVCLNMFWILWTMYNLDTCADHLHEAKKYLDFANDCFNDVSDRLRGKILFNYSTYYYNVNEFEEAVNVAEQSLKYFGEADLPRVYNNLVAMYLNLTKSGENPSIKVEEYLEKAEVLSDKYKNNIEMGKAYYNRAMYEVKGDQLFAALDSLYISFEYFKQAEALTLAFDCLLKINELVNEYKVDRLKSLKNTFLNDFLGVSMYYKSRWEGIQ